jgi:hypothetical protein
MPPLQTISNDSDEHIIVWPATRELQVKGHPQAIHNLAALLKHAIAGHRCRKLGPPKATRAGSWAWRIRPGPRASSTAGSPRSEPSESSGRMWLADFQIGQRHRTPRLL